MHKFIINNFKNFGVSLAEGRHSVSLSYYNDKYIQGDLLTVSSIKVNDLFKAVGSIVISKNQATSISFTGEKQINSHYFDAQTFATDLSIAFKPFQITFEYDQKLKCFSINLDETESEYKLECFGNMKLLLGAPIAVTYQAGGGAYVFSQENSFKIEYIKVICKQLNACCPTCYQNSNTVFSSDTVAVMHKSDLNFTNPTLDVHMQMIANCPLNFELLDQNDQPVSLTYCIIEGGIVQNFQSEFADTHKKLQAYLIYKQEANGLPNLMLGNNIVNSEMYFSHIAIQCLSGTTTEMSADVTDLIYEIYINELLVTVARAENISFKTLNQYAWIWQKFPNGPAKNLKVRVEQIQIQGGKPVYCDTIVPDLLLRVLLK